MFGSTLGATSSSSESYYSDDDSELHLMEHPSMADRRARSAMVRPLSAKSAASTLSSLSGISRHFHGSQSLTTLPFMNAAPQGQQSYYLPHGSMSFVPMMSPASPMMGVVPMGLGYGMGMGMPVHMHRAPSPDTYAPSADVLPARLVDGTSPPPGLLRELSASIVHAAAAASVGSSVAGSATNASGAADWRKLLNRVEFVAKRLDELESVVDALPGKVKLLDERMLKCAIRFLRLDVSSPHFNRIYLTALLDAACIDNIPSAKKKRRATRVLAKVKKAESMERQRRQSRKKSRSRVTKAKTSVGSSSSSMSSSSVGPSASSAGGAAAGGGGGSAGVSGPASASTSLSSVSRATSVGRKSHSSSPRTAGVSFIYSGEHLIGYLHSELNDCKVRYKRRLLHSTAARDESVLSDDENSLAWFVRLDADWHSSVTLDDLAFLFEVSTQNRIRAEQICDLEKRIEMYELRYGSLDESSASASGRSSLTGRPSAVTFAAQAGSKESERRRRKKKKRKKKSEKDSSRRSRKRTDSSDASYVTSSVGVGSFAADSSGMMSADESGRERSESPAPVTAPSLEDPSAAGSVGRAGDEHLSLGVGAADAKAPSSSASSSNSALTTPEPLEPPESDDESVLGGRPTQHYKFGQPHHRPPKEPKIVVSKASPSVSSSSANSSSNDGDTSDSDSGGSSYDTEEDDEEYREESDDSGSTFEADVDIGDLMTAIREEKSRTVSEWAESEERRIKMEESMAAVRFQDYHHDSATSGAASGGVLTLTSETTEDGVILHRPDSTEIAALRAATKQYIRNNGAKRESAEVVSGSQAVPPEVAAAPSPADMTGLSSEERIKFVERQIQQLVTADGRLMPADMTGLTAGLMTTPTAVAPRKAGPTLTASPFISPAMVGSVPDDGQSVTDKLRLRDFGSSDDSVVGGTDDQDEDMDLKFIEELRKGSRGRLSKNHKQQDETSGDTSTTGDSSNPSSTTTMSRSKRPKPRRVKTMSSLPIGATVKKSAASSAASSAAAISGDGSSDSSHRSAAPAPSPTKSVPSKSPRRKKQRIIDLITSSERSIPMKQKPMDEDDDRPMLDPSKIYEEFSSRTEFLCETHKESFDDRVIAWNNWRKLAGKRRARTVSDARNTQDLVDFSRMALGRYANWLFMSGSMDHILASMAVGEEPSGKWTAHFGMTVEFNLFCGDESLLSRLGPLEIANSGRALVISLFRMTKIELSPKNQREFWIFCGTKKHRFRCKKPDVCQGWVRELNYQRRIVTDLCKCPAVEFIAVDKHRTLFIPMYRKPAALSSMEKSSAMDDATGKTVTKSIDSTPLLSAPDLDTLGDQTTESINATTIATEESK